VPAGENPDPAIPQAGDFSSGVAEKTKPPQLKLGRLGRLALAAFVKRPQADAQIGAMAQIYNGLSVLSTLKITVVSCSIFERTSRCALFGGSGRDIPA
jgi:hypothetical protein